jgi:integrase
VEYIAANSSLARRKQLCSYKNDNNGKRKTAIDRGSIDPLQEKINLITKGIKPFYRKMLKDKISRENTNIICDYLLANKRENNVGSYIIQLKIQTLVNLSEFLGTSKMLTKESADITKNDIQMFLDRYRKDEQVDPYHKWIGSYNLKLTVLLQFFKWLYDPDNPEPKSRKAPSIVAGIRRYKRKEESIYSPEDLWTEEDDLLFLKYVNNPRDRCYHMVSRYTACRPSELLKTRISQLNFKTVASGRNMLVW